MKNKILMMMIVGQVGLCVGINAQNVGISASPTFTPDASAILDISSTTKGLLIPRSSSNPSTTTNGLMFYNTTSNSINVNTASNLSAATFIPLLSNITVTSPLSYTTGTGTLTLPVATTGASGYLASGDWTTFNNKQPLISNPNTLVGFVKANGTTISYDQSIYLTTISGTANYLPKYATSSTFSGTSLVYDNGATVGINLAAPTTTAANSTLQINGSFATSVVTIASATAASNIVWSSASLVLVTASSTITLPTAVNISGRIYTIKSAGVTVSVATSSSQTIDGSSTALSLTAYKSVTVQSDNANWNIIGSF